MANASRAGDGRRYDLRRGLQGHPADRRIVAQPDDRYLDRVGGIRSGRCIHGRRVESLSRRATQRAPALHILAPVFGRFQPSNLLQRRLGHDLLADVDRSYPDIVEHNGTLVVAYVSAYSTTGATYTPWCRVLGSAYATLSLASPVLCQAAADSMDWGSQSGGVFNSGEMSIWRDEDDRLWIMGRDHQGGINTDVATRTSDDGGSSWVDPGGGPSAGDGVSTWRGQDADTYPRSLTVCAHRGRAMVAHQCAANPGTLGPSIMAAFAPRRRR